MSIPKLIHQIWWQGEVNLPNKYKKFQKSWKKNHLQWKYCFWDQTIFEKLLNKKYDNLKSIYESLPLMIQKIDFAKYVILYEYGGVYVDMDTISNKSLEPLLNRSKGLLVSKLEIYPIINFQLVNNGIIFAKPSHNFFKFLIQEINSNKIQRWYQNSDLYIMYSTGPISFSKSILNYSKNFKDVIILPSKYLESCSLTGKDKDYHTKKSYITHIHDSSWTSNFLKIHFELINIFDNYKYYILVIFIIILIKLYLKVLKKNI